MGDIHQESGAGAPAAGLNGRPKAAEVASVGAIGRFLPGLEGVLADETVSEVMINEPGGAGSSTSSCWAPSTPVVTINRNAESP